jgi:predicted Rossmann fold flavoprotein
MSQRFEIAVVGGGAAGLAAAIAAAREGRSVVVADRMPRLGKKILITGGGRCNLSNERLPAEAYASTNPALVSSVLSRFGPGEIVRFFEELGLLLTSDGGRLYPATNQASSVLKVLEIEIRRLGVSVVADFEAAAVVRKGTRYAVQAADGRTFEAAAVVLAGGGRSYPALGSNGSAYELARRLGHRLIDPVPSCVPLLVKDRLCQVLQGQRLRARAEAWIDGRSAAEAEGDILFASYGLSGTAILDISTALSVARHRDGKTNTKIGVDFLPLMTREALAKEIADRLRRRWESADLISGLLPEKFAKIVAGMFPGEFRRAEETAAALTSALKDRRFDVHGTRGWNEAEFTSGGVDAGEIESERLESRFNPGLHFAGEIIDVQGPRGGFNLAWAWASGVLAGRAAAAVSQAFPKTMAKRAIRT